MPEPTRTPDSTQLVTFAEITGIAADDALELISGISTDQAIVDALWEMTLTDMDAWADIRLDAGDIKRVGPIEFFDAGMPAARLSLKNLIRTRYGLSALATETDAGLSGVRSGQWFC